MSLAPSLQLAPFEGALEALLPELRALRAALHRHPDLSGNEAGTAARIRDFLQARGLAPWAEHVGGHGLVYRLEGQQDGSTTLLRADLDALPLIEGSRADHASVEHGRHHACGHDGHATMLAGAIAVLNQHLRHLRGTVYFLFQPAEETGAGMAACLADPALRDLAIPRSFAIHNLPGFPFGQVMLQRRNAAAASTGVRIGLTGATSHASEPYLGRNPIPVLADLVHVLQAAPAACLPYGKAGLATLVHLQAGQEAYGSSPESGQLGATLRADEQEDLDAMLGHLRQHVEHRAQAAGLSWAFELVEPFPATVNHPDAVAAVERAAATAGLPLTMLDRPFPWSEDFGHAARRWPGALIGLGAGTDHPVLHSAGYDFPEALLGDGIRLWLALVTG
jgi:amidohydrolase